MLKSLIIVSIGGGIGAAMRWLLYEWTRFPSYPIATLLVNISGSFAIGIIAAFSIYRTGFTGDLKLFLATGICGGFTTFSAFSIENMELLRAGKYLAVLLYITVSIVGGITASFLGFKLFQS